MVPVLVTLTKLEYSVIVVVNVVADNVFITAEDTTVAITGNELVNKASVIVEIGKMSVAAAENSERISPGRIFVVPSIVVTNGSSPERISMSPDCARMLLGLLISVN